MSSAKKQLLMSCFILLVSILLFAGSTFAYFSDKRQIKSTVTVGNVSIALSEAEVTADSSGNLVEDTNAPRIIGQGTATVHNYGAIYPGQSIFKDPTILNTGSEKAWVAAKVTLTDGGGNLHNVMGYEGYTDLDIELLLGGGLLDEQVHVGRWNGIDYVCHNDHYAMVQVPNAAAGEWTFYFFFLVQFAHGDEAVLFKHLRVPADWNNADMKELAELTIDVQAFGVQSLGFETCFEAMTTALADYFPL